MNIVRRVQSLEERAGGRLMRLVPAGPVPLDSPADVLAVIAEQVNAVRADAGADPVEKARTLGLLAGIALRAIESRDVIARLEAVERVLKLRADRQKEEDKKRRW